MKKGLIFLAMFAIAINASEIQSTSSLELISKIIKGKQDGWQIDGRFYYANINSEWGWFYCTEPKESPINQANSTCAKLIGVNEKGLEYSFSYDKNETVFSIEENKTKVITQTYKYDPNYFSYYTPAGYFFKYETNGGADNLSWVYVANDLKSIYKLGIKCDYYPGFYANVCNTDWKNISSFFPNGFKLGTNNKSIEVIDKDVAYYSLYQNYAKEVDLAIENKEELFKVDQFGSFIDSNFVYWESVYLKSARLFVENKNSYYTASIKRNYKEAQEYCKNLSNSNFNGWRLPTILELQGIMALFLDQRNKNFFQNMLSGNY